MCAPLLSFSSLIKDAFTLRGTVVPFSTQGWSRSAEAIVGYSWHLFVYFRLSHSPPHTVLIFVFEINGIIEGFVQRDCRTPGAGLDSGVVTESPVCKDDPKDRG